MLSFLSQKWSSLDLKTLLKVFLNTFLIFLGVGFYAPYMDELLHKVGFSDAFIGISVSIELSGFILGALFLNKILQRFPHKPLYLCALISMTLILGTLPLVTQAISLDYLPLHILFVLRFFFGLSAAYIYILHDFMISHFASSLRSSKTTLMGLYFTTVSIGAVLGSMGIDILNTIPFAVSLLAILIFAGCCFLIFSPQFPSLFKRPSKQNTLFEPFKILLFLPLLIFITTGYALGGKVTRDLLDIYAQQANITTAETTFLLSILMAGSLFLPPFLGHIADKIKLHRALILYCALLSIAYSIIYFNSTYMFLNWPIFFLIGGMYAIFDGLGLTYISSRLTGTLLVSGCMTIEISESLSGVVLLPLVSDFMTYLGPKGFSGSILILYLLLLAIFLFFYIKDKKEKMG